MATIPAIIAVSELYLCTYLMTDTYLFTGTISDIDFAHSAVGQTPDAS